MAPSSRWGRNSEPITPLIIRKTASALSSGSDTDGEDAIVDGPADGAAIFIAQKNHDGIGPLFYTMAEDQDSEDGGNQNREDQRAEQGEQAVQAMGLKRRPSTLRRENGQIGGDDGARVENRAQDFHYGVANDFEASFARWTRLKWRTMFSMMTTVPSTAIPKSERRARIPLGIC